MKVQGEFKMQAHIFSGSNLQNKGAGSEYSVGRWMKVQGKFKMQAHPSSGVVMDIAAFKVSHSVGPDSHATALQAARASSSSIHRGDG